MSVENLKNFSPTDPELIDKIVNSIKAKGIFDQFRRDCLADVDTKPAYQNLQQRVNGTVTGFLASQKWQHGLNKTQLRESLRRHTVQQAFLEVGVDRIVDQVVNPKIFPVFMPKVEDVVCECLGIEKPKARPIEKRPPPLKLPTPPPRPPYRERGRSTPPREEIKTKPESKAEEPSKVSDSELIPVTPQVSLKENPELPEDLEPVSPASEPEVVNNDNNDDDSSTFDEMPLLAALIDADSVPVEPIVLDSVGPQTCITKSGGPSEVSNSHSMMSTRPPLEYDTSTNNLSSLKSDDKLSPTKKFDNFSNLGEKLKQADVNLRETSVNKMDDIVVDLTELSKSSENESQSQGAESKVEALDESNFSCANNFGATATKDDLLDISDESFSSPVEPKTKSDESSPLKLPNHKKSGSSYSKESKHGRNDKEKENFEKASESKKKDKSKTSSSKESNFQTKSSESKSATAKDKSTSVLDKHAKHESEKDKKDKRGKSDKSDDTKKVDKVKKDEIKVNDSKYSSKKKKDEASSHQSTRHSKDSKSGKKSSESVRSGEKEKHKEDKEKKSDQKSKSDSSTSNFKSDKKKADRNGDKNDEEGDDKKKGSRKRKSGRCNEEEAKNKNSRRSSDRDGSGSGGSGKPQSNNPEQSETKKSKSDKGRSQHKSKSSSKGNTDSEYSVSFEEADEVDKILMEINNSIEDENLRVDVNELFSESVKKPKIANNFHEMKKIMQARKHIDRAEKDITVSYTKMKDLPVSEDVQNNRMADSENELDVVSPTANCGEIPSKCEDTSDNFVKQVGLRTFSIVVEDVLKGSMASQIPPDAPEPIDASSRSESLEKTISVRDVASFSNGILPALSRKLLTDVHKSSEDDSSTAVSVVAQSRDTSNCEVKFEPETELKSESNVIIKISLECSESKRNVIDKNSEGNVESPACLSQAQKDDADESRPDIIREVPNEYLASDISSAQNENAKSSLSSPQPVRSSRRKNAGSLMYAILEEFNEKVSAPTSNVAPSMVNRLSKRKSKLDQKPHAEPTLVDELVTRSNSCTADDGCDISNKENDETNVSSKGKNKNDVTGPSDKPAETRSSRKKNPVRDLDYCKTDIKESTLSKGRSMLLKTPTDEPNALNPATILLDSPQASKKGSPDIKKRVVAPLNLKNSDSLNFEGSTTCSKVGSLVDTKIWTENNTLKMDQGTYIKKMSAHSMENIEVANLIDVSLRRKSCPAIFHSDENDNSVLSFQPDDTKLPSAPDVFLPDSDTVAPGKGVNCHETPNPPSKIKPKNNVDETDHRLSRFSVLSAEGGAGSVIEGNPVTAVTCVTKNPTIEYAKSAEVESKVTLPPKELVMASCKQLLEQKNAGGIDNLSAMQKRLRSVSPTSKPCVNRSPSQRTLRGHKIEKTTTVFTPEDADVNFKSFHDPKNQSSSVDSLLDDSAESDFKGFSSDEGGFNADEECRGFTDEDIRKAFNQLRLLKHFIPDETSLIDSPQSVCRLQSRATRNNKKSTTVNKSSHFDELEGVKMNRLKTSPRKRIFSCTSSPEKEKSTFMNCKTTSKDSGLCDSPEMEKSEDTLSEHEATDDSAASHIISSGTTNKKRQLRRCTEDKTEAPPAKKQTPVQRRTRTSQSYKTSELYKPRPLVRGQLRMSTPTQTKKRAI